MKRSKIIWIIVFSIAALAVAYFAYGVVKERYFGGQKNDTEIEKSALEDQMTDDAEESDIPDANESALDNPAGGESEPAGTSHLFVTPEDCEKNCEKFKNNEENLKYCREVCGDVPVSKKDSEGECADLSGLEKDYCWRDLAVSKKDFGICDKIADGKLKKICRNRVTEEILN